MRGAVYAEIDDVKLERHNLVGKDSPVQQISIGTAHASAAPNASSWRLTAPRDCLRRDQRKG